MLDAIKGLRRGGKGQKQAEELEALIATAREERTALSAMLTQVTMRGSGLAETGKSLEQVDKKTAAATGAIEALARRIGEIEQQARALGDVERRALWLDATVGLAQEKTEKLLAPDGDLEKHRRQIQELATQASAAESTAEALKREREALEEFRHQLRQSHAELKDVRQSVDQATVLRGELEQLRGVAGQLTQDYAKLRDTSHEADDNAFAALQAVKDIEGKLGKLVQLQDLSRATEEKLSALNSMAEHVGQKTRVLEGHKHVVDRAVVEIKHVNDLVWKMDVQIAKLKDGLKEVARGEEIIARIDAVGEQTRTVMETASRVRDDFMLETARVEKEGRALVDVMRANVEKIALEKKESEVLEQRLNALHGAVQDVERRMEALSVKERHLAYLPQRIGEFGKDFETLAGQADDLARKQASLETLRERLAQVEDMSSRTTSQYESLRQSRGDLEALRKEIQDFHHSYAEAAQLRDRLGADRMALEAFTDRLSSFRARVPEIQSTLDAVLDKMSLVEDGTRSAARLGDVAAELDAQLTRVTGRTEVVEILEGRLNALHLVAAEVDTKLAQQLTRRVELDTLKSECDGVVAQMIDAHQKIEGVAALQGRLLPMETRLTLLQDRLEQTGNRVKEVQRDETVLSEQEARLTELVEASRSLANDATARLQQTHALTGELARAAVVKDELIDDLARVQARQREALARAEAAEEQLRRAETMYSGLEQRRSQLAFSEKKLAGVEIRMAELSRMSAEVDARMQALAARDAVVAAVKAEVDNVHQISARSKEDLQYVSAHREDVVSLRRQVQDLLAKAGEVEEKIASVEAHRRDVEEVQSKAFLISNLLQDVRVNLETVSEQKALIDHLAEKLANIDFVMQEAQNTLRMLNQERELAERIEHSIKQLRGRGGATSEEGRQSA